MKKLIILVLMAMLIFTACENGEDKKDEPKVEYTGEITMVMTPSAAAVSADEMDDAELIAMAETLYTNVMKIYNWTGAAGISLDHDTVLRKENDDKVVYVAVTSFPNMASLIANCEAVLSKELFAAVVFPQLAEGEYPLFIEEDGKLYMNMNVGGGVAIIPDYTRAKVIAKTADTFEIEIPMVSLDNEEGEMFVYKAVRQNDNWVLDSHYYFQ